MGKKLALVLFGLSLFIGFIYASLAIGAQGQIERDFGLEGVAALGGVGVLSFLLFIASIVVWWKGRPPKESHIHIHTNALTPTPNIKYSDKYCPHCGSSVIEGARFCGQCGKEFT